ncbi:hypothetical protein ACWCQ0_18800 [Streptomyces massasporeus]|uniref:Alpha amylase inhibitor n=1 Tax=Streptomyces massasporeus TaxID=67324 RepID=A0ABW6L5Q5_9ACTN
MTFGLFLADSSSFRVPSLKAIPQNPEIYRKDFHGESKGAYAEAVVHQVKGSTAMKRFVRSTVMVSAVVLAVAASGTAAGAQTRENAGEQHNAPECVHFSAGWRYTLVTNDCSSTYTVKVVYRDGFDVPCRVAPPGAVITFPGYGTQGNEIMGLALCDAGGGN